MCIKRGGRVMMIERESEIKESVCDDDDRERESEIRETETFLVHLLIHNIKTFTPPSPPVFSS